jgi:hypothetical protein
MRTANNNKEPQHLLCLQMRAPDYFISPGANPARPRAYAAGNPLAPPGGFVPSQSYMDAAAVINGGMNVDTLESLGGGRNPTWRPGPEEVCVLDLPCMKSTCATASIRADASTVLLVVLCWLHCHTLQA